MAAQFLTGRGFKEVYSLAGGIKAWQGLKAVGPVELNLDLIRGDETPLEMIETAWGMEEALGRFYALVVEEVKEKAARSLLKNLIEAEKRHQQMLHDLSEGLDGKAPGGPRMLVNRLPQVLEGGFQFSEFLSQNRVTIQTLSGVLEVAMMLETQALDLYLRFGLKMTAEPTKKILYKIADEEKAHLSALGQLLK